MKSIKDNLKFLTEIALFYPVILQAISDVSKNSDPHELIFKWGLVIFALIISYLLIDKFSDALAEWVKNLINIFIITTMLFFAFQFYLFALIQGKDIVSYTIAFALGLTVVSVVTFPLAILLLTVGYLSFKYFIGSFNKSSRLLL